MGVGNQRQPFGVIVQFTPATYVCILLQKKVDRTLERMSPVSSCGNDTFLGIDVHNRTGRDHGVQSAVILTNDAPPKLSRQGRICTKNSGVIWRPILAGSTRNGKSTAAHGVELPGDTERNSCPAERL
jgi:hypothetical protein